MYSVLTSISRGTRNFSNIESEHKYCTHWGLANSLQLRAVFASFTTAAMGHLTKASWGGKGLLDFSSLFITEGNQDRNWNRQEPGCRGWWRGPGGMLFPGLLGWVSYRTKSTSPGVASLVMGLALPVNHWLRKCTTGLPTARSLETFSLLRLPPLQWV